MISIGIEYLDKLTGGLKLGDNVVWSVSNGAPVDFFIRSFFQNKSDFKNNIIYVSFNSSPQAVCKRYDYLFCNKNVILLDAFTHGKGNSDPVFLDFYYDHHNYYNAHMICIENPKDIKSFLKIINEIEVKNKDGAFYIFDSLTGMNELWKDENAVLDFFAFSCPRLYDLNTLAYWIFEKEAHSKEFIAGLTHITQIVFSLSASHSDYFKLNIIKLEDRPSFHDIGPNFFKIIDNSIQFQDKRFEDLSRIGEKVKEQRKVMKITQAELAASLGMTPGAVSQIENANTAPSLHTLIQLSSLFNKPIGYFIDNDLDLDKRKGYTISTKGVPKDSFNNNIIIKSLIDKIDTSIKSYWITIKKKVSINGPILLNKGKEFIIVIKGSINLIIDEEINHLEKGNSILIKTSFIEKWENINKTDCELIYIML